MKINLKVRIKNPVFWLTIIPAMASLGYAIMGALGIVPAISEDALVNSLSAIIAALTTLGVLVDPTTSGVNDSARALEYDKPQ